MGGIVGAVLRSPQDVLPDNTGSPFLPSGWARPGFHSVPYVSPGVSPPARAGYPLSPHGWPSRRPSRHRQCRAGRCVPSVWGAPRPRPTAASTITSNVEKAARGLPVPHPPASGASPPTQALLGQTAAVPSGARRCEAARPDFPDSLQVTPQRGPVSKATWSGLDLAAWGSEKMSIVVPPSSNALVPWGPAPAQPLGLTCSGVSRPTALTSSPQGLCTATPASGHSSSSWPLWSSGSQLKFYLRGEPGPSATWPHFHRVLCH